ncbi:MAG: chorismate synthase [Fimbriimonadaceae bacterium]|nr:chorismate synthase [Fimbriimonadaceae bacterium]
MASVTGQLFRVSTFGESHGPAVGVVVDGCPPRLRLTEEMVQRELDRRRPGQSKLVTQRKEADSVEILSGVLDGLTLGTPVAMLVRNQDQRGRDYDEMREKYRPSHADFAYDQKFGIRAWSGGGRASARETVGRVAAGAVAKALLADRFGVEVVAWVDSVQGVQADVDPLTVTLNQVEAHIVRCPDLQKAEEMTALIEAVRKDGDSVGGCVRCVARGVPAGWGEPVFDKLEADLAKALMSLPASKGFEVGSGFAGTMLRGTQHNDPFRADGSKHVTTTSNNSGGIQGGISNGMPVTLRVAFKPVATVMHEQDTVDVRHENTTISGKGRHDACVLPRAVPMVEAMVALVLADHALRQHAVTFT